MRRTLPRLWPADLLVVALALAPALVALPALAAISPNSAAAWLHAAGRLTGVIGLGWLLLAALLAVRLPGWDRPLGGLTRLWRIHHVLGTGAFLLLLAHPILLALAAAPGGGITAASATLFPPPVHWEVWVGWVALLALMAFLAPTYAFFGAPKYQRWKLLHTLSGLALLLGLVHALPLATLPAGATAWVLWGLFGCAALAAYVWRAALARVARKSYRIVRVEQLAPRVVELSLASETGEPLRYQPGQFIYLTPQDASLPAGRGEEHPYTLTSAPHEHVLRLAIKDLGDASHALQNVTEGSFARVEGPHGRFFPDVHREPELWIGGGIGVAPFVSRVRSMENKGEAVDIRFLYCTHGPERAYFLAELQRIAAATPGLHITAHYFANHGPLDRDFLTEQVPDFASRTAYICGPQPLIRIATGLLRGGGVARSRIHTEEFDLL